LQSSSWRPSNFSLIILPPILHRKHRGPPSSTLQKAVGGGCGNVTGRNRRRQPTCLLFWNERIFTRRECPSNKCGL
jgi:hypothetical protein